MKNYPFELKRQMCSRKSMQNYACRCVEFVPCLLYQPMQRHMHFLEDLRLLNHFARRMFAKICQNIKKRSTMWWGRAYRSKPDLCSCQVPWQTRNDCVIARSCSLFRNNKNQFRLGRFCNTSIRRCAFDERGLPATNRKCVHVVKHILPTTFTTRERNNCASSVHKKVQCPRESQLSQNSVSWDTTNVALSATSEEEVCCCVICFETGKASLNACNAWGYQGSDGTLN